MKTNNQMNINVNNNGTYFLPPKKIYRTLVFLRIIHSVGETAASLLLFTM